MSEPTGPTERAMDDKCPRCGSELEYDEVDIGVGVMRGNPGCPECHWTPPEIDLSPEVSS